jgi:hypothetical protein
MIVVPSPRSAVVVVTVSVECIDTESPSVAIESDRTIEVVDSHEYSPLVFSEQCLKSEVACK